VANISYNVSFHGFLRKTGNAKIDHPTNGPTIDLGFGDDKKSAADNVWDLYNHGSISGYNTWIDWNWIKNNYPNYIDVIENKIHNSPEFVNVLGKFTYNYSTSSMRDGLTSPLYPLSTIMQPEIFQP
jgi:hypothetical protein